MMIERVELAFPKDGCVCSLSVGWTVLLLGGGYFKDYEAGIIFREERLLFFIGSLE